jgi:hypothetical protein
MTLYEKIISQVSAFHPETHIAVLDTIRHVIKEHEKEASQTAPALNTPGDKSAAAKPVQLSPKLARTFGIIVAQTVASYVDRVDKINRQHGPCGSELHRRAMLQVKLDAQAVMQERFANAATELFSAAD